MFLRRAGSGPAPSPARPVLSSARFSLPPFDSSGGSALRRLSSPFPATASPGGTRRARRSCGAADGAGGEGPGDGGGAANGRTGRGGGPGPAGSLRGWVPASRAYPGLRRGGLGSRGRSGGSRGRVGAGVGGESSGVAGLGGSVRGARGGEAEDGEDEGEGEESGERQRRRKGRRLQSLHGKIRANLLMVCV